MKKNSKTLRYLMTAAAVTLSALLQAFAMNVFLTAYGDSSQRLYGSGPSDGADYRPVGDSFFYFPGNDRFKCAGCHFLLPPHWKEICDFLYDPGFFGQLPFETVPV